MFCTTHGLFLLILYFDKWTYTAGGLVVCGFGFDSDLKVRFLLDCQTTSAAPRPRLGFCDVFRVLIGATICHSYI